MHADQSFDELPSMLTVEETMSVLRTKRTATYEAIRRGDIPAIRVGRSWRVPKHRLAQLMGLSDNGAERDRDAAASDGNLRETTAPRPTATSIDTST